MTLEEFSNRIYRNSGQMRQFSMKLTRNSMDAEDLVQQTLLRAYIYRHLYDPSADVKHWLVRIMKNQFINDFRYQAKRNTSHISIEHLDTYAITNLIANQRADSDLFIQEIHAAVNSLVPIYRLPLTYYVQGFKYKEIAEKLGLTLGTVKRRIFEARKMLGKNGINSSD